MVGECGGLEGFQHLESRHFLGLREHDIEADHIGPVAVEQLVHEPRHLRPTPRPPPLLGQAFLVDFDDDDPVIDGIRHGQDQALVIGDILQPFHEVELEDIDDVSGKQGEDQQADDDPQSLTTQGLSKIRHRRVQRPR